jgi:hypothetical protein
MRPLFVSALVLSSLLLGSPAAAQDEGFGTPSSDRDIKILDDHFGLHLGASIGAMAFSVGALSVGIHALAVASQEPSSRAAQSRLLLGLTLTSMGVATVVSSASGIQRSVVNWRSTRTRFDSASLAQRRLLREAQINRLRQMAASRAIGLVADGTVLGLGIVLMAVAAPDLGLPLVLDGALILGIDIFRIVVDDRTAARWQDRDLESDSGYFSERRRRLSIIPMPVLLPPGQKGSPPGAALILLGAF